MGKKVANQLVEQLSAVGVKHIYAIAGDSLNSINDAIRNSEQLKWVHVRHEESGAFAATAESMLTGIGCCAGSSGPGHVHLVNGLYDAHHSHCSVVAVASTCPSQLFGNDYFQSTNTQLLFDDCSCYNAVASTPKQFAVMMPAAIRHAIGCGDVAVVGLPGDVARDDAEESAATFEAVETKTVPRQDQLQRLSEMIGSSQRITLFCGYGATSATDEVLELAALLNAPVVCTFRSKMALSNNPFYVGMTGLLGVPSAYQAMFESDMILMLGTDFPYSRFIPKDCRIAQIDIRPAHLGRRADVELSLCGHTADTLRALLPMLQRSDNDEFLRRMQHLYARVVDDLNEIADHKGTLDNISPEYLTRLIDRKASDNVVFTLDTGMCCSWGARYLSASPRRAMLASFNHGSMCNALPMAIGAAMACEQSQIVALCGDGGLSMILGELATVVQYALPIKIVVFNNRALGMVKLEMEVEGYADSQTNMINPDFAAVAAAFGIESYSVRDPEKLEQVMERAFAAKGAVLVEVFTNPNALTIPPKITASQIYGFSMSLTRLLLDGNIDELMNIVKTNFRLG